jgi:galactosyl transferase GMA12/MNN10 family
VNRALVTFAVGGFQPLLELAQPGLEEYADRHGYTLLTDPPVVLARPPSWHKITTLLAALEDYEEALWIDCDTIIVDPSLDLADEIPPGAWQAITVHHTPEGEVPSAGVWYARQPLQPVLEAIWRHDEYLHHRWWEQAALQHLLGYTPNHLPVHLDHPTEVYDRTHWLGLEWNTLAFPGQPVDPSARIVHAAAGHPIPVRAQLMTELTPAMKGA